MLERQSHQEYRADEANGQVLEPAYFIGILKRRALYFAIPFLLISTIGSLITIVWPARYVSEGTILISSQEIPIELVRPTVAALANDRIQLITQRIMTRDKLLAIAKKFQLSANWQARMSGTELVDFIRERTNIQTAEDKLQNSKSPQGRRKEAVAFTVGFNYEQPQIAMKVANELVTMILNEDVRSRTDFATETSRFLGEEVKRLEVQLSLIDAQISTLKHLHPDALTDTSLLNDAKEIAMLRAELLLKSASYSDAHPDIRALKRKIQALEKSSATTNAVTSSAATNANTEVSQKTAVSANGPGIDTLETQRKGLREELNKATEKLSAARLGENLERGRHSERLEVIEQPSLPQKPASPNKPKIFAFVFGFALMAGGGMVFAAEMLNQSIRRSADLFSIIDSHLIVSIPYISTQGDVQRRKNKIVLTTGISTAVVLVGLVVLFFILPPVDVLFEKAMAPLFR